MTEKQKDETTKPCEPRITNDEKVEVNEVVNKKLTAMSKETKARKKKKLEKPPKDEHTSTSVSTMSDNQMFLLLGIVGVIIAGVSLYYQRKSATKDEKKHEDEKYYEKLVKKADKDHNEKYHSEGVPEPLIRW